MNAKIKVLIADSDKDFCILLKSFLAKNGPFDPIILVHDGQSLIETALSEQPQAIISDVALPNIDGLSALREIITATAGILPITFLLSAFSSEYAMTSAKELGVDQFILKPCHFGTLAEHLKCCCNSKVKYANCFNENNVAYVSIYVSNLLSKLKIPTHLRGYRYLFDCITTCICQKPTLGITKSLYPEIGKKHNVTAYCVERSIRAAITYAWEVGRSGLFTECLPSLQTDKKPTNWQLICAATAIYEQKEMEMQ